MEIDWMQMVRYQQQLQKISRYLFPVKKQLLTPSECELLAWLYLHPEKNTPVMLSQCSAAAKICWSPSTRFGGASARISRIS